MIGHVAIFLTRAWKRMFGFPALVEIPYIRRLDQRGVPINPTPEAIRIENGIITAVAYAPYRGRWVPVRRDGSDPLAGLDARTSVRVRRHMRHDPDRCGNEH